MISLVQNRVAPSVPCWSLPCPSQARLARQPECSHRIACLAAAAAACTGCRARGFGLQQALSRHISGLRYGLGIRKGKKGSKHYLSVAQVIDDHAEEFQSPSSQGFGTKAIQLKDAVSNLRDTVKDREIRAHSAEKARDVALAQLQEKDAEVKTLRSALSVLTRYAEDLERERDQAEELIATRRQKAVLVSQDIKDILQRRSVKHGVAEIVQAEDRTQAGGSAQLAAADADTEDFIKFWCPAQPDVPAQLAVADMDHESLRHECSSRGLLEDGSVAVLRARVRAARAQDKRNMQVLCVGITIVPEMLAVPSVFQPPT